MMNFMLWSLYFWCCVPFIYCASFIFNSPVKAYAALLCWNVVVSLIALLTDVTLEAVESPLRNAFHYIAFVLLPSFTLGNGMVQIAMHAGVEGLPRSILFNALEQVIWCMIISGLLFWTLLFLLDSKRVSLLVHNIQCRVRKSPYQIVSV
jgi:hypothetical protein